MNITVNNINIYYDVIGKGRQIILLNPNSVDTNAMNFIAKKLSKDFEVYIFHRRCCGKSEKNCTLTYEESAADVCEFIKVLKLEKPYILGCSGGATVALNLAINNSELIGKLICCSGVARPEVIQKPTYAKIMEKIPFYPGKQENEMFEKLNNSAKSLTEEQLNKISVPTLIVNGGKRDIVPISEAQYLNNSIKNSKLLILENEGHFSYMINCKWYYKLLDFLLRN